MFSLGSTQPHWSDTDPISTRTSGPAVYGRFLSGWPLSLSLSHTLTHTHTFAYTHTHTHIQSMSETLGCMSVRYVCTLNHNTHTHTHNYTRIQHTHICLQRSK